MNEFNSVEAAMVILKAKKECVMRVENQLSMCNYVPHQVPIKIESSSPLNNQIVQACAVLALCTHDTMHHSNKFQHHSRMVGNGIVTTTSTTMSSVVQKIKGKYSVGHTFELATLLTMFNEVHMSIPHNHGRLMLRMPIHNFLLHHTNSNQQLLATWEFCLIIESRNVKVAMVMHVTLLWTLPTPHIILTVGSDHESIDLVSDWKSQISSFKIIESERNA